MSTVTVTMAFGRPKGQPGAHPYIREAVESILDQTHKDWRLVIVNDADPEPPWPYLRGIDDPRIIRFDLPVNRGRYFVDAVIFEALQPDYWALQDPDDHCAPDRFARMLPLAQEYGAGFAPTWLYRGVKATFDTSGMSAEPGPDRIRHMVGYGSGVISGERLRAIGGFHPGFRVAYDTWMMNAVKLVGPWVAIEGPPLQHKLKRRGGLTMAPETGNRSPYRRQARERLDALWREAYRRHEQGQPIAPVIRDDIPSALAAEVTEQAGRLRSLVRQEVAA